MANLDEKIMKLDDEIEELVEKKQTLLRNHLEYCKRIDKLKELRTEIEKTKEDLK